MDEKFVNTFYLDFVTDQNETLRLIIPMADMDMTADDVETGMLALIENGGVSTVKGTPKSIKACTRVSQKTTAIQLS